MEISLAQARRLMLRAEGLDGTWRPADAKEGAAEVIERLGYVQIDTIHVVQRAHHHILWSRHPGYRPGMADELVSVDRRAFEWWSWNGTAAYLPMADYRYYAWAMARSSGSARRRAWLAEHAELVERILARIRDEGPLGSSDFAAPEGFAGGGWWDWKPAKRALDYLYTSGSLMVAGRRSFQRLYDLPERVLPPDVDTTPPDDDEVARFLVRRTLGAQGLACSFGNWLARRKDGPAAEALRDLVGSGEVVEVRLEGASRPYYALADALALADGPDGDPSPRILSPFDPLTIDRRRLADVFGFDFALECYLPAEKRRYGYYLLPILWEGRFVARMDVKAQRGEGLLLVRNLVLEPGVPEERFAAALVGALDDYAAFNGCDSVAVEASEPPTLAGRLGTLRED